MGNIARRLRIKNNIDIDHAISESQRTNNEDLSHLVKHLFADIDADFASRITKGNVLIAGDNFGSTGSGELGLQVLKSAGITAVIAKSFGRIFYRNAFNMGFLPIECNTEFIDDGDEIEINIAAGKVQNLSKGLLIETKPIPKIMKLMLEDGGTIGHFKKNRRFNFEQI